MLYQMKLMAILNAGKLQMAQGNPNPSPETRFKPGQSGNPGGKTSEHKKAETKAAELAAKSRLAAVQAFANLMNGCATDEDKAALVSSDVLRLWKESEDRGFGSPQQHIDNTSSDGSMTPKGLGAFYADQDKEPE